MLLLPHTWAIYIKASVTRADSSQTLHSQLRSSVLEYLPSLNDVLVPAQHPGLVQLEGNSPECVAPKSLLLQLQDNRESIESPMSPHRKVSLLVGCGSSILQTLRLRRPKISLPPISTLLNGTIFKCHQCGN